MRQYDSDIGRWLSVDSHRQYWFPYVSVANDPVNTIDKDRADGILLIDYTTKTIIVNAVYYVTHGLASQCYYNNRQISNMQTQINSMLNSQKYSISQTGFGSSEFDGYRVVFNLQFIGSRIPNYAMQNHVGIFSGNYTNKLGRSNNETFSQYGENSDGLIETAAGHTRNNNSILMNNKFLGNNKGSYLRIMHEIFHTFGFGHINPKEMDGIMAYPPNLPTQTDINMLLWTLPMFINPLSNTPAVDNPVKSPVIDSCDCYAS